MKSDQLEMVMLFYAYIGDRASSRYGDAFLARCCNNKTANVLDNSQTLPKAKEILPYKYNLCRIGLLYRGEAFIVTGSWKITHYILICVGLNIVDCINEI